LILSALNEEERVINYPLLFFCFVTQLLIFPSFSIMYYSCFASVFVISLWYFVCTLLCCAAVSVYKVEFLKVVERGL